MPRASILIIPINLRSASSTMASVAIMASLGHSLTWAVGIVTGINSRNARSAWWQTAKYVFPLLTASQWLALIAWSVTTGVLVAAGIRKRRINALMPLTAFVAGALVPVGITFLGGALAHVWPGTDGPADAPMLTLLLVIYSLGVPWVLGRLMTGAQSGPTEGKP